MNQPPTGTVTFLFTDIEGSTRIWEDHPDAMRPALARHDDLLRQSIEDNGGFVFKTVGDAFCAAFATAPDALRAALSAQQAVVAEAWDLPAPLLVRMALHTGAAEERGGDYFGQPLNRVERLMSAGHGMQTLLSGATQELVRDHLPDGASLRDLGARRLKDLGRSEQVFQLLHPTLPADFPPLRSLDNPDLPNNLPQQITSFIGREKQVEEVKTLLTRTRLLTLTGAGGGGKTRLSLQVAADLLDRYFDGVWLVELAALSDPALVPQAVADVLGVKEEPGQPISRALAERLKFKRLLLILDNCEHLVAACATLATDLLRSCPGVHLLTSSREPLKVAGEQTYRVPSLTLPDAQQAQTVESLSQYEAVRLFIERTKAVQPSFAVTDGNAPAVAQVCWRLDGIPLAIELAAARVRALSAEGVSTRLDDRFRLLTGGSRTALPRQQTLRALIDWSYDLLTEQEKKMLCRLSVFAGGWTLAAAEAVCAGGQIEEWQVLDLLTSLVDKSLVVYEEEAGDRYRFLETVRQYAGNRLEEGGEAEAGRERLAVWFLGLAEEGAPQLTGPEQASWLRRLETEHDNLRASLAWFERLDGPAAEGLAEGSLRLVVALCRFWAVRGHYAEGRQWAGRALAAAKERDRVGGTEASAVQARALFGAGYLAYNQSDYEAARAAYEESLRIQRQLGNRQGVATMLDNLGNVAYEQGDYGGARSLYEESLALARQLGNQQGIASCLGNLGNVAHERGDYASARALHEECVAIQRHHADQRGVANSLNNLGNAAHEEGDYPAARALHEESLGLQRQLGNQRGIANSLLALGDVTLAEGDHAGGRALYEQGLTVRQRLGDQKGIATALTALGHVAQEEGDYAGARTLYEQSLALTRQIGDQHGIARSLEGLAGAAASQGQTTRGTRLWGAADALRTRLGAPLTASDQQKQAIIEARQALGDGAFAAAWDGARAMTLEQAVEYALGETET